MAPSNWEKVPPALADTVAAEVALRPELTPRKMFGMPAAFARGHLTTGLFGPGWLVRLAPDDRAALMAADGSPFAPMQGRVMREYVLMPAHVLDDPAERAGWIDRALAFVRTLPPKA